MHTTASKKSPKFWAWCYAYGLANVIAFMCLIWPCSCNDCVNKLPNYSLQ